MYGPPTKHHNNVPTLTGFASPKLGPGRLSPYTPQETQDPRLQSDLYLYPEFGQGLEIQGTEVQARPSPSQIVPSKEESDHQENRQRPNEDPSQVQQRELGHSLEWQDHGHHGSKGPGLPSHGGAAALLTHESRR